MMRLIARCVVAVFCFFPADVYARVTLPSIIGDGMVLQRHAAIPIWGKALPGEAITVRFNKLESSSVTTADSVWRVNLPPCEAGGPYTMQIIGADTIVVKNILVGEVWICSGQSNMEFTMAKSSDAGTDIPRASDDQLRLFLVKREVAEEPRFSCDARWEDSSPSSVKNFSAVAYYFGKRLREELGVPVGLVQPTWGGTPAECWIDRTVLETNPVLAPIMAHWREDLRRYPEAKKEYDANSARLFAEWEEAGKAARASGLAEPPRPQEPRGPGGRNTPGGQYNAMIAPLIPYAMKGVIWYQGEANAARAYQYRTLFPALIELWRSRWGAGDFPFYFVQLPNLKRGPEPSRSGWAELREAQLLTLRLPKTGMAVTIDVGDSLNLHPTNKKPVGNRLALLALAKQYGRDTLAFSGPLYKSMRCENGGITLSFDFTGKGLCVKNGRSLEGFVIAGEDRIFHIAEASIAGNEVRVATPEVAKPVAVRYAWADNPPAALYNIDGLPASPFRTDDWPEVTFEKR
jgi:sialate O-acetylesterase